MYFEFYGLISEPFRTTPDADALFFSPSHREALSSILYGIKERKGVIVVTGEVGVGKTTILRRYLQIAAPLPQKTIHIYNPNITFERLLITILTQLTGQPHGEASEMVSQLHELALAEQRRDSTVVLVIDEAQCMPMETLEGIRMLSNLETANEKLIQIVLMGQPELDTVLDRHELRHVRERIAVRARILPLTKAESAEYIQHRLIQVSREQRSIFSSGALAFIIKTAEGIPRRLNIVCDNALIAGFRLRQPIISRAIAKQVIADMHGVHASPWWRSRTAIGVVVSLALLTIMSLYLGFGIGASSEKLSGPPPEEHHQPKPATHVVAPVTDTPLAPAESTHNAPASSPERVAPITETPIAREQRIHKAPLLEHVTPATSGPTIKLTGNTELSSAEKMEVSETARLLAVLMDAGRVVLGKAQPTINNPRLEDKGFSPSVFEGRLRKEFQVRTGHDLRNLPSSPMPDRAKPLLLKLVFLMLKEVHDVQPDINKKGIGYKGFIPATFATKVAQNFTKETGLKVRQIGPPGIDPRNPANKPDEQEEQALLLIQKNHPRVGDHVMEQQLPDKALQILLPLFYTRQCLACHGKPKGEVDISGYEKEGFKEGDLGGAISVILPVTNAASVGKNTD
ncbi:MAG: AAA family ATPase [Nitrospirota bacterium]|nr:AAA family ATPase [Nitrospirota bacterium]